MRVLMVTTSFPRHQGDHAGHFVAMLAERLVGEGHTVTVLAPHEADLPRSEMMSGVRVERFKYLPGRAERVAYGDGIVVNLRRSLLAALGLLPFALSMRRALRSMAADHDLVHVHWAPTAVLGRVWRADRPFVITLHGSDVTLAHRGGLWMRVLRKALALAAGVDVVAEEQRRFLLENGLWDDARPLEVIPAGVDEGLLERPRGERSGGPFRFVFAGRLVRTKGVLDLLDATRVLIADGLDIELVLVGAGPLEDEVRSVISSAGLGERVRQSGRLSHEETLDAIAAADALVLPSYGEGSPLVVAEALAVGTPVIGTRVGAMPELLGVEGPIVEPGDVAALSGEMRRLATDQGFSRRLAEEGRERVAQRLTWGVIARATGSLYDAALTSASSGRS